MNEELKEYIIDQGVKQEDVGNLSSREILEWKKLYIEEKYLLQGLRNC